MKATIKNSDRRTIATARKKETEIGFPDYIEKAETGAIGRALAMCGYGTLQAPEFDEGERIADSPIENNKGRLSLASGLADTPHRKATKEGLQKEYGIQNHISSRQDTSQSYGMVRGEVRNLQKRNNQCPVFLQYEIF